MFLQTVLHHTSNKWNGTKSCSSGCSVKLYTWVQYSKLILPKLVSNSVSAIAFNNSIATFSLLLYIVNYLPCSYMCSYYLPRSTAKEPGGDMQVEDKRIHWIGRLLAASSAAAAASPTPAVLCNQKRTRQTPLQVIILCCSSEVAASIPGPTSQFYFSYSVKRFFNVFMLQAA